MQYHSHIITSSAASNLVLVASPRQYICSCQCLIYTLYTPLFPFCFSPCSLIPLLQIPVFPSLFVSPHTETQNCSRLLEHFVLGQFHPSTWYCWTVRSCNLRGPPSNSLSGWGDMRHSHLPLGERQTQIRKKKLAAKLVCLIKLPCWSLSVSGCAQKWKPLGKLYLLKQDR